MTAKESAGLLVRVQPLRVAEGICWKPVDHVRVIDGALQLAVAPA